MSCFKSFLGSSLGPRQNVGPMLNGYVKDEKAGSGSVVWEMRKRYAAGKITYDQFLVSSFFTNAAPLG
mgnify:FL=1